MLLVDYLQKIAPPESDDPRRSRNESTGEIVEVLKNLASDLDIPVLALCQLNRDSEKRDNRRPRLADLRDSGRIEEEADCVCFLHRPHMGRPTKDGGDDVAMEMILAKGRNVGLRDEWAYLDGATGVLYSDRMERDLVVQSRQEEEVN